LHNEELNLSTGQLDKSTGQLDNFNETLQLVKAIAQHFAASQDPLAKYKALEYAANHIMLLPTSKIQELTGAKPSKSSFQRGIFIFYQNRKHENRTGDSLASSNDIKCILGKQLSTHGATDDRCANFSASTCPTEPLQFTASSTTDKLPLEKFHRLLDLFFRVNFEIAYFTIFCIFFQV
jgi:hypothetical protein